MIADELSIKHALQTLIDNRQKRIRHKAVLLIAFGLAVVYMEAEAWESFGTLTAVAGIGILVMLLRGVFDIEQQQVAVAVQALEQSHYNDVELEQLWYDTIDRANLQDLTCARSRGALITLCAITVLRERQRMPKTFRSPDRS
jgi:hypothetical protein